MSAIDGPELERRGFRPGSRIVGGFLVSLAAIAAVVWWALHQQTPTFPTGTRPILLLVAGIGGYAVATIVRGVRWHLILDLADVEHRRVDALALTVVGYMGNNVLPARAGELLRVFLLKARSSASRREIFGSIIAERLLDTVTLAALFVVMTVIGIAGAPTGRGPALIAASALAASALGAGVLIVLRRRGRLERFATMARPFLRATRLLLCVRGATLALMTSIVWLLEGSVYWLVARALELPVTYVDGVYLVVLASLVAMVPAGPGFIGTVDAAIIFGLAAIGIKSGQALSFAILIRFVVFVPITVVGLLLMLFRYGGLGRLRVRAAREAEG
jgi:uncharacterized membrane protein YbhN (UPF0104 family)